MARLYAFVLALATAFTVHASTISQYYEPECIAPAESTLTGVTPIYCNVQQGQSVSYELDYPCEVVLYSGINCEIPLETLPETSVGCINFPTTVGDSFSFICTEGVL